MFFEGMRYDLDHQLMRQVHQDLLEIIIEIAGD